MNLIDITDLTDSELDAVLGCKVETVNMTDVTDMTPAEFAAFMEEGIAKAEADAAKATEGDRRNGKPTRYLDGYLLTDDTKGDADAF